MDKKVKVIPPLIFNYINYRNETSVRTVSPIKLWYGKTNYHKKEQWFLKAWDMDKEVERDFAFNDIRE